MRASPAVRTTYTSQGRLEAQSAEHITTHNTVALEYIHNSPDKHTATNQHRHHGANNPS